MDSARLVISGLQRNSCDQPAKKRRQFWQSEKFYRRRHHTPGRRRSLHREFSPESPTNEYTTSFLSLSVSLFAPATVLAQQSLYQSHDGDTSIFLQGTGGVVGANIGKSDIRLSYLHEIMNRTHLWSWGADLSGALKGTSSQLLNGATPAKSGAFNVSVKKRDLLFKPPDAQHPENSPNDDWLIFQVGYQRSQLKLIDTSASPLPAPTSHGFDGYTARVAYNALLKTAHHDFLLGASLGMSRTNNMDDLNSIQVTDSQVSVTDGVERRASKDAVAAFVGAYKKFIGVPINADAIWYPGALSGRIGFDGFVRSQVANAHRSAEPGIGVFFCKAGQPARPIGGATLSSKDGKAKAALVVGW